MTLPILNVLRIVKNSLPLFDQLCLEEALLRADQRNWLVISNIDNDVKVNDAKVNPQERSSSFSPSSTSFSRTSNTPTIVMGVAGKVEQLVNINLAIERGVPVIRRFTGGGTVVVDSGTFFASFIVNKSDAKPSMPLFPREIMRWSADNVYTPVFDSIFGKGRFSLREHDYCWDDKKVGGNAQSVSRDRWVHHTSFLWSFDPKNMDLLQMPDKRPEYRRSRSHSEFLTPIGSLAENSNATRTDFVDAMMRKLSEEWDIRYLALDEAREVEQRPQALERKTNTFVNLLA